MIISTGNKLPGTFNLEKQPSTLKDVAMSH
jgi:hypothetical protein